MHRFCTWAAAAVLGLAPISIANAQGIHAVKPLEGYACMMLNLSNEQMRDNSLEIPVFSGPSKDSGRAGNAAAVVIAKSPLHLVNGFAELLFPTGKEVWIEAGRLKPYHSESNPNAHCTPSIMSNGKPGFG
jgi:hypothetical protein